MRPWTQLSASPRTVHFRWKSFLDHVDHATFRCMHASIGVVRPHCQPFTYSHFLMTLGC